MADDNSTADDLKEVMGFIGQAAGKALGDKFREQEAQKKAGTHGWVKQSDGTSKWLPLDPAAGRPTVSTSQPVAGEGNDPAGIPRPKAGHGRPIRSIHGRNAPAPASLPAGPAAPAALPAGPARPVAGEGNDPKGTERPRLAVKKQSPNG